MLSTVCELNALFLCNLLLVLDIIMSSIKKCFHNSEPEWQPKPPFLGLGRTAPHVLASEANVFVTVATKYIMRRNGFCEAPRDTNLKEFDLFFVLEIVYFYVEFFLMIF